MRYLGIDVSKAKLDCSLLLEVEGTRRRSKSVPNTAKGFKELIKWLGENGAPAHEVHAVMEGTGVYHENAAMALSDEGVGVSIANPAQVRDFARGLAIRTKNDEVDSLVLARYGALTKPAIWTPPAREVRVLKALIARRDAIQQDLLRESNRQEKAHATVTPSQVTDQIKDSLDFLHKQIKRIDKEIEEHIDRHPDLKDDLELLRSIPAVGTQTGVHLLSILREHRFDSAEQAAAYLGVVPIERKSGTSVAGRPRLSKTGPARVRAVLYMASIVAIQWNAHAKAVYERLTERGKTKMAALGAVMRKLVHLCYGVLRTRTPYRSDYLATA